MPLICPLKLATYDKYIALKAIFLSYFSYIVSQEVSLKILNYYLERFH